MRVASVAMLFEVAPFDAISFRDETRLFSLTIDGQFLLTHLSARPALRPSRPVAVRYSGKADNRRFVWCAKVRGHSRAARTRLSVAVMSRAIGR